MNKTLLLFGAVTAVLGFFLAASLQSPPDSDLRETRNMPELRQAVMAEKERQQELQNEISRQTEILYQLEETEDVEKVMDEVIYELEEKAGLTEVRGQGLVIDINIQLDPDYDGGGITNVPPYLLRLLINELNIQGADHIAIANERIVSTTAVREANGRTLVNGGWLGYFPIQIRVLSDDPESLHHAIMSSQSRELFLYEHFNFTSTVKDSVVLPAYGKNYRTRFMEPVQGDS